jgi:predicted alpha/beta superfamily hydrolase
MTAKQAAILASEVRMMKSKNTGRNYRISIALPYAYFNSLDKSWPFDKPLEKWPVVYLTDATWYFGMVTDMVRSMAWCGATTDAIIVGIGYVQDKDPKEAWRDAAAWRSSDLLPVQLEEYEQEESKLHNRKVVTGGAGKFLQFIKQELIPAIESEFKADPKKRILVGHSDGGVFTAFALFEEPGLFENYIVGSPGLVTTGIFEQEEQFSKRHKKLHAKVHLWVGGSEESINDSRESNMVRFGAILESRKYTGLSLVRQIFANENHCEVIAPGFQAGLKMALKQ